MKSSPDDRGPGASDACAVTLELFARRASGATVCPSEVARAIATASGRPDWGGEIAGVHSAVEAMLADGLLRLSWKRTAKVVRNGPYRIGRAEV